MRVSLFLILCLSATAVKNDNEPTKLTAPTQAPQDPYVEPLVIPAPKRRLGGEGKQADNRRLAVKVLGLTEKVMLVGFGMTTAATVL